MSEKHLVCKGATVYCNKSMVNNNPGTALPLTITSQMLVEINGGKTAATDKDCTPANMCFGNCNPGTNPPPPCVANVQWSKFYEDADVTEAGMKFLTEESEATCMTFGGKVKIAYHGQTASPQPEELAVTSPEVMSSILPIAPNKEEETTIEEKKQKANIIEAYWIDGGKNKQHELPINEEITLFVKVDNPMPGKIVRLEFNEKDDTDYEASSCSGIIDDEGIIEVNNFKLRLK